jgi:S1-C subfamily serine protease
MIRPQQTILGSIVALYFLARVAGPPGPAQQSNANDSISRANVASAVVELVAIGPGPSDQTSVCSGTGFLVNGDGYLVTSAHVVAEAQRCLAGSAGAKILARPLSPPPRVSLAGACEVAALDQVHDLAVLKLSRPLGKEDSSATGAFVSLYPGDTEPGTSIGVRGHPSLAWQARIQEGHVTLVERLPLSETSAELSQVLVLDIALEKGASGSPVYRLADGAVVGVVEQRDALRPDWTVAASIDDAIDLLERYQIRWHASR